MSVWLMCSGIFLCCVGRAVAAEIACWSAKAQSGDFRQEIKKGMQEQTPHAFRTY